MTDDALRFVSGWYAQNCDEDWEHSYGVSFRHTPAAGWAMTCDLIGTKEEGRVADWAAFAAGGLRGVRWRSTGVRFEAVAATTELAGAFQAFRAFVRGTGTAHPVSAEPLLDLLGFWAARVGDGGSDTRATVRVDTLDNPGWSFCARTEGTSAMNTVTPIVRIDRSEVEWLHWWSTSTEFEAACGARSLVWALDEFRHFVATVDASSHG